MPETYKESPAQPRADRSELPPGTLKVMFESRVGIPELADLRSQALDFTSGIVTRTSRAVAAVFERRVNDAQFDNSTPERDGRKGPRTQVNNRQGCVLAIAVPQSGDTTTGIMALDLSPLPAKRWPGRRTLEAVAYSSGLRELRPPKSSICRGCDQGAALETRRPFTCG